MTSGSSPATPTCESCAAPDHDLAPVHRVYVDHEARQASSDGQAGITVVDDVEHWCFSCRSQYPHEPA